MVTIIQIAKLSITIVDRMATMQNAKQIRMVKVEGTVAVTVLRVTCTQNFASVQQVDDPILGNSQEVGLVPRSPSLPSSPSLTISLTSQG